MGRMNLGIRRNLVARIVRKGRKRLELLVDEFVKFFEGSKPSIKLLHVDVHEVPSRPRATFLCLLPAPVKQSELFRWGNLLARFRRLL